MAVVLNLLNQFWAVKVLISDDFKISLRPIYINGQFASDFHDAQYFRKQLRRIRWFDTANMNDKVVELA